METRTELEDLLEHMQRYRAVTLQALDMVRDDEMDWRPSDGHYSLGQQLLHIAQTEDLYAHGLFDRDWNYERARFPDALPDRAALREMFARVRAKTTHHLATLDPAELSRVVEIPGSPLAHTLRSWLWFLVEHEMHHKAQIGMYLRQLGRTPPFYAMPLAAGERPDVQAREALGGF